MHEKNNDSPEVIIKQIDLLSSLVDADTYLEFFIHVSGNKIQYNQVGSLPIGVIAGMKSAIRNVLVRERSILIEKFNNM